jgi:hypothetical protein
MCSGDLKAFRAECTGTLASSAPDVQAKPWGQETRNFPWQYRCRHCTIARVKESADRQKRGGVAQAPSGQQIRAAGARRMLKETLD